MSDKTKDKGVLKEIVDFLKSSKNFLQACEKPKDEFKTIAKQCALGFVIMGTIGFVIKLIFLMINNILLS
jgi:protein transport protein SEC61 subunit gamma-like protein